MGVTRSSELNYEKRWVFLNNTLQINLYQKTKTKQKQTNNKNHFVKMWIYQSVKMKVNHFQCFYYYLITINIWLNLCTSICCYHKFYLFLSDSDLTGTQFTLESCKSMVAMTDVSLIKFGLLKFEVEGGRGSQIIRY